MSVPVLEWTCTSQVKRTLSEKTFPFVLPRQRSVEVSDIAPDHPQKELGTVPCRNRLGSTSGRDHGVGSRSRGTGGEVGPDRVEWVETPFFVEDELYRHVGRHASLIGSGLRHRVRRRPTGVLGEDECLEVFGEHRVHGVPAVRDDLPAQPCVATFLSGRVVTPESRRSGAGGRPRPTSARLPDADGEVAGGGDGASGGGGVVDPETTPGGVSRTPRAAGAPEGT